MNAPLQPVLILGAGINGAALARQLVLNQIPVCVVDLGDVSCGATAASSRLIHGGLRYLEYGDVKLVRESLAERTRLLRLAPQFIRPLQLHIPVRARLGGLGTTLRRLLSMHERRGRQTPRGLWLVRTGLWMYDRLAWGSALPSHALHRVGEAGVPEVSPQYRWTCSYYDAQILVPERFVVALLEDARQVARQRDLTFQVLMYHLADLDNGTVRLRRAAQPGQPNSQEVVASFQPAAIVNATGAWVDRTLRQLKLDAGRLMGGTKGSHFFTYHAGLRERLRGQGVYVEALDGRPIFVLPQGDCTLVGTTDLPFEADPASAVANDEELTYLLESVNRVFAGVELQADDIELHYSGVRPLPYSGDRQAPKPGAITRRHALVRHTYGQLPFYSIVGGKLTTCRCLAEEATARLLEDLQRPLIEDARERLLPGGEGYPDSQAELQRQQQQLAQQGQLEQSQVEAVWQLCGTRAQQLLQPGPHQADRASDKQSVLGTHLPRFFVRQVLQQEWVTRLADLVERRLMLLYHRDLSVPCLRELAELMADEGLLSPADVDSEVTACRNRLRQHFGKQLIEGSEATGRKAEQS